MALRLIELYLPATQDISKLKEQLAEFNVLAIWEDNNTETRSQLRMIPVTRERSSTILKRGSRQ